MTSQRQNSRQQRAETRERAPETHSTAVEALQSRGNDRLLQRRGKVDASTDETPAWIRDQLGIGAAEEERFAKRQELHEEGETITLPGGGVPLAAPLRQAAQEQLAMDLGHVRVIEGADSLCNALDAQAFASGSEIYLSNAATPSSAEGQFTLMHELSHVEQQGRGKADGLEGVGGDEKLRRTLEDEADVNANQMLQRLSKQGNHS